MASPLEWMFAFWDKASGPAEKIAKTIDHVASASDKATKVTAGFDTAEKKLTKTLGESAGATAKVAKELPQLERSTKQATDAASRFHVEWGNAFKSFAGFRFDQHAGWTVNVAEALTSITGAAAAAGRAIVSVFDTLGQAQESRERLEDAIGSGEAKRMDSWLKNIEAKSAFRGQQLRGFAADLGEHFRGADLERVLVASLDVGRSSEARVRQAIEKFRVLGATGKIEGEAFKVFGLEEANVYSRLMERSGLKSAEAVKKALAAGKIGKQEVLESILDVIGGKEGGQLGGRMMSAGETIAGRMNRLRGIQESFIDRVIGTPENIKKIEAMLGSLATSAERIIKAAERATEWLQDPANAWNEASKASTSLKGPGKLQLDVLANQTELLERAGYPVWKQLLIGGFKKPEEWLAIARTQAIKEMGGAAAPEAHDFIWRSGRMVQVDPADTLIGAKGALGAMLAAPQSPEALAPQAPAGGLSGRIVTLGEGAVQVSIAVEPGADAGALSAQLQEMLPGALIAVVEKVNEQMGNG